MTLQPGLTYRLDYQVPEHRTVPALLPESEEFAAMPHVLATGYLVGLIEWACMRTIASHLTAGQRTVGVHVDLSHEVPTPAGSSLSIEVELVAVSGRHLMFSVRAHDDVALVSRGTHHRAMIDLDTFTSRLQRSGAETGDSVHPTPTSGGLGDGQASVRAALAQLERLQEAAASTPLADPSWQQLRVTARWSTATLVEATRLPPHLQVAATDPPVVVARVLAMAWRHLGSKRHPGATQAAPGAGAQV